MTKFYVDEGLQKFDEQWLKMFPGATIYHIGDSLHSKNPDVSQHAPELTTGPEPGRDTGEIDAGDYMQGKGVTIAHLRETFNQLLSSRDPRILYVILEDKIFSSTVFPWQVRPYRGDFHHHLHLSVNDNFDANNSDWKALTVTSPKTWKYKEVDNARLPEQLTYGMEDTAYDGWNHIMRAQGLLNILEGKTAALTIDGVYGAYTAQKVKAMFGGNGRTLTFENLKTLHGFN